MTNLRSKYDDLVAEYYENQFRTFHLRSICNFIDHFDELPNEEIKSKVRDMLTEYMDFVGKNIGDSDIKSMSIFKEFVEPIGITYSKTIKFKVYPGRWIWVVSLILINIALLWTVHLIVIDMIVSAIILVYQFQFIRLKKEGRIYSFKY